MLRCMRAPQKWPVNWEEFLFETVDDLSFRISLVDCHFEWFPSCKWPSWRIKRHTADDNNDRVTQDLVGSMRISLNLLIPPTKIHVITILIQIRELKSWTIKWLPTGWVRTWLSWPICSWPQTLLKSTPTNQNICLLWFLSGSENNF